MMRKRDFLQKISVEDAFSGLSKIYLIANGARRSVADVPDRPRKSAVAFGLKLYPKIVRS